MIDARASPSPFGIVEFLSWDHPWNRRHNASENLAKTLASIKEVGASTVRFDFLWSDIEPKEGQFDFSRYDPLMEALAKNNIKVLALLLYSPAWDGSDWRQAPDPKLYCRYARAVAGRYKKVVRDWEIWNEPDHPDFWQPQDQMRTYVQLLKRAYTDLKKEDPSCIVHLGGLSNALPGCLKNIYEQGAREFFDVVGLHAFANPLQPEAVVGLRSLYDEILSVMRANKDAEKKIWLTQISCPGMIRPEDAEPWWLRPNLTEEQQAVWLKNVFQEALKWPNIGKLFWSFLRDTDRHFNSGVDYFGLLRHDFSKKPAFVAYQDLVLAWHDSVQRKKG